jgi:hypothetical protein
LIELGVETVGVIFTIACFTQENVRVIVVLATDKTARVDVVE